MRHHPYAVFFDVLWDVTNPRGIDADRAPDTAERRDGPVRRAWLRLWHSVESSAVESAPAVPSSGLAVPRDAASEDAPPDGDVAADAPPEPPRTPLAAG